MSYSNGMFSARPMVMVIPATSFGTATASATDGANRTAVAVMPSFIRKTNVTGIRLLCTVVPNASSTALVAQFLTGTNTLATVTLTTATAGQWLTATIGTASNGTFTAGQAAPTINITGTATASAAAQGSYSVWFEQTELYA